MKNNIILLFSLFTITVTYSQDEFLGMASSPRGGSIAADINPSELSNMYHKYEVGLFAVSANFANDRMKINDFSSDNNTQLILDLFKGDHTTNARFGASVRYPSFAMKFNKWGVGFSTQSHVRGALFDTSYQTGDFNLKSSNGNAAILSGTVKTNGNSRISVASWSEMNFSVSRTLFENEGHKFNGGLALKLLFPATYINMSIDQFTGTAEYNSANETVALSGITNTNLNIDYTGENSPKIFGGMNGFGTDIGFNYQLKDSTEFHKLNVGVAFKNIGSMTYKSEDGTESFNSYNLNTQTNKLDFDKLGDNSDNLTDVQEELILQGVATQKSKATSRKVSLPTSFVLNVDYKIVPRFHVSAFVQQKFKDPAVDYVIPIQNVYALTPRYATKYFDVYSTWASYELSGLTGGLGFRVGGFYIGSRSLFTGLASGKQVDVNIGLRLAFGK